MPTEDHARRAIAFALALAAACGASADPLSKKADVDFYRDVPSRDLHGLATRSDGRLVAGPVLTDLKGHAPCELLWCLEPEAGGTWLVGGGPGGRIMEVRFRDGQIVNAGDTLFVIDPSSYQAAVAKAETMVWSGWELAAPSEPKVRTTCGWKARIRWTNRQAVAEKSANSSRASW